MIYTSEMILDDDGTIFEIQEKICSHGSDIQYQLTPDEMQWLVFINGRYSIADYLMKNVVEDNIVILNDDLSRALDDDCEGYGKAVMLSDDTALQMIFFYCYQENT